jgi:tRNA 2-thiouridine synthesizing protein B
MATLHIVRQSAYNTSDFFQCMQVLGNEDVIAFIDDGCYNLQHSLINSIDSSKNIQFKVITLHANARAIKINEDIFEKITMENLVSLTFENDRVITWQ